MSTPQIPAGVHPDTGYPSICPVCNGDGWHLAWCPRRGDPKHMSEEIKHVESTSNDRTLNNTMRHQYRVLSESEKAQMLAVKDLGAAFVLKLHEIGGTKPIGPGLDQFASRDLALANTHIEDAVMRAVRHITR